MNNDRISRNAQTLLCQVCVAVDVNFSAVRLIIYKLKFSYLDQNTALPLVSMMVMLTTLCEVVFQYKHYNIRDL